MVLTEVRSQDSVGVGLNPESTLDGVLIVEGYNVSTIKTQGPNIEKLVAMSDVDLTPLPHQIYVLSYMLRG